MYPYPRPWWPIVRIGTALNALLPLGIGVLLVALAIFQSINPPQHGFGSFAVIFMVVAVVFLFASLPYVVASIGLWKHQRWAVWLAGIVAMLQGAWELLALVRAMVRAQAYWDGATVTAMLIIGAHLAALAVTVFAAGKVLAATRAAPQRGFPVTVAGA